MMLEIVHDRVATGVTRVVGTVDVLRCGKQMEKLPHYYFSWIVSSRNRDKCEMLPLETKHSGGKLLPHSDLRCGVFVEETPRSRSNSEDHKHKQKKQKENHSFKIGTWNVRTLNQKGKLENLKKEMQKNAVSVLGVSAVRWKGEGEIRSGDYTVYYCGGDRAERGVAIAVHKSVVKSVVKKSVYSDRIIAVKLKAEPVSILIVQVYMSTSEYEDDELEELYDIMEDILEEDGRGATNVWLEIKTLLDHMDWEGGIRDVKCLLTSVKEMGSL
jgi:hypothetical protein